MPPLPRRSTATTPLLLRRYSVTTPPLTMPKTIRKHIRFQTIPPSCIEQMFCYSAATPPLLRHYSARPARAICELLRRYSAATPLLLRRYSTEKPMKTHTFRTATPPLLRRTAESQSQILCALLGRIAPHPVLKKETYFNSGDTWSPQLRGSPQDT